MALGITLSKKSLDTIIGFEVGSEELYNKKYTHPVWAGGSSGLAVGIGYDFGYNSIAQIKSDWTGYVSNADLQLLCSVSGLKGEVAKNAIDKVKSVTISFHDAETVFINKDVLRFSGIMLKAYPGANLLTPDTQGALVSLVFNRGGLIDDTDRRKEMKAIKSLVLTQSYKEIAAQFRSMKRLWNSKTAGGLIKRREMEAVLVENSVRNYSEEEKINL